MTSLFSFKQIVLTAATLGFGGAWSIAHAEPAIGQFELKTLESDPGAFEFQSQNAWSWGQPARHVASDDTNELVLDENAVIHQRHALELEVGFTKSLKMRAGIEFEKERLEDPETLEQANAFDELQLSEFGIELIAVLLPRRDDGAGIGVVIEYERPVDREEPDTLIVGSIAEWLAGRWFVAAVPMAVRTLGGRTKEGDELQDKWDFAYATQLAYRFFERWSLAFEGYGTIERLAYSGQPSVSAQLLGDFDQHRAGAVLYRTFGLGRSHRRQSTPSKSISSDTTGTDDAGLTIGIGWLAGLNQNTPDYTLKLSIEVDF